MARGRSKREHLTRQRAFPSHQPICDEFHFLVPAMDNSLSVGIIGMGEMGRMYAKCFANGGRRRFGKDAESILP